LFGHVRRMFWHGPLAKAVDFANSQGAMPEYPSDVAEEIAPVPPGDRADVTDGVFGFQFVFFNVPQRNRHQSLAASQPLKFRRIHDSEIRRRRYKSLVVLRLAH